MRAITVHPKPADVLALARAARKLAEPIAGELAAVLANLIHEAGLDFPGQYGNAYFCCPDEDCGVAHDCVGEYDVDIAYIRTEGVRCRACGCTFGVEDLRLSEWWVERL